MNVGELESKPPLKRNQLFSFPVVSANKELSGQAKARHNQQAVMHGLALEFHLNYWHGQLIIVPVRKLQPVCRQTSTEFGMLSVVASAVRGQACYPTATMFSPSQSFKPFQNITQLSTVLLKQLPTKKKEREHTVKAWAVPRMEIKHSSTVETNQISNFLNEVQFFTRRLNPNHMPGDPWGLGCHNDCSSDQF